VTAIFLIVVLAALGAFMVTISGLQQTSGALDVQGARAYQAARAGIEWKTYQVVQPPQPSPNCVPSQNLTLSGTLSAFTVTVQCTTFTTANELGIAVNLYQITSTACNAPSAGNCPSTAANPGPRYLERRLQATVGR
jgi:MSHA biogenesis protein MshP